MYVSACCYFLALKDAPRSCCVFPVLVLESVIVKGSLVYFYEKSKSGYYIYSFVLKYLHFKAILDDSTKKYIYLYLHTHISIIMLFLYVTICAFAIAKYELWMMSPVAICYHMYHSSVLPLLIYKFIATMRNLALTIHHSFT